MSEAEKFDAANAYPVAEYLGDLKRSVWGGSAPDAGRRQLQRVYLQRLEALVNPPAAPAPQPGAGAPARPVPFVTPPNVLQSDLPALARAQLRDIQREARAAAAASSGAMERAHWNDVADRVSAILDPRRI